MQPWIEIVVELPVSLAEELAGALAACGGVELRDPETLLATAPGRAEVRLPVPADELATRLAEVRRVLEETGCPLDQDAAPAGGQGRGEGAQLSLAAIDGDGWRDRWRQFFGVQRAGRLIVRPSWLAYAPQADEVVIDLDPGRAFGTGGHASTRLCLLALDRQARRDDLVVRSFADLGCGSGILAIAAARLWPAASGVAVDVDPEAVEVARENVDRNHVSGQVSVAQGDAACLPGGHDLLVANLSAEALGELAPVILGRLGRPAVLILSGILAEAVATVLETYRQAAAGQDLTLSLRAGLPAAGEEVEGWSSLDLWCEAVR